jgi:hypothetical protein
MSAKAFRFDEPGARLALRHPLLQGKKLLGRGNFSAVFEGTRPNTALKLTVDGPSYWMANDKVTRVTHRHFTRVHDDHQDIGEISVLGRRWPIYLYEVERLSKLRAGSQACKLARSIIIRHNDRRLTYADVPEEFLAEEEARKMVACKDLPGSVRNAFKDLARYCSYNGGNFLDLHMKNFMERANGQLVMTDPIGDLTLVEEVETQLQIRRW